MSMTQTKIISGTIGAQLQSGPRLVTEGLTKAQPLGLVGGTVATSQNTVRDPDTFAAPRCPQCDAPSTGGHEYVTNGVTTAHHVCRNGHGWQISWAVAA